MIPEIPGRDISERLNQFLRHKKKKELTGQLIDNLYAPHIKPFFHLQDPISLNELSRTMSIAMCRDWIPNAPNHVEIYETALLSGRVVKKYHENDSYCGVRKRGWQYGTVGGKGEYDGDAWSEKTDEFMNAPEHRRCPFCESLYKQVSLVEIINSRVK